MAAGGIRKQVVGSGLQLLQRQVLLQKAQRAEGFVLIKMQLFAAGLPAAAGRNDGKVGIGKPCPVLGDDLFRRKAAGALAALQRTGQMSHGGSGLLLPGQLGTADQHPARVGRLGCQHVLSLRRKRFRQHGIHYGDHIADVIPAVQRVVPQHIKKLVHIKDAAGFHHHPVEPAHGHGNELGAHPALVGVAVASAADGLKVAVRAKKVLHQHCIHIHCAEVVFQNADIVALCHQIPDIPTQKGGFACAQKASDKVYLYHNKKAPPVLLFARSQYTAANCNTPVADAKAPHFCGTFCGTFYVRIQPLSDTELYSAMILRAAGAIWAGTAAGFARK